MANETTAPVEEQAEEVKLISVEEMKAQIKPLSQNAFVAFWQKIYRAWLGVWYGFSDKHPKLSGWVYKIVFFFAFSMGVTIWQYLVMTFLPYVFGGLAEVSFIWPKVQLGDLVDPNGDPLFFAIFNEPAKMVDGKYVATAGLSNFLAFEIAVFTAQIINFPLQRNITFKSKGNPVVQAIWYFIGWVLISIFVNAIWGIIVPFVRDLWQWPSAVWNLLKTFITGGVSMIIFFFIFLIIFPDLKKVAAGKKKKYEKLCNGGATEEQIAKAKLEYDIADEKARLDTAEKEMSKAISQASAMAVAYDSRERRLEKMKTAGASAENIAIVEKALAEAHVKASKAYYDKVEAIAENDKVKAEVAAQREARGEAA